MRKFNAIYVRVSTADQQIASQIPDLERWAEAQHEPHEWFQDKFSGRTLHRPGLEHLLREVASNNVRQVVVWRLDRLGRTARGLLELVDELQARGVGLVSLKEGFDLSTPAGKLLFGVLASVAAYETELRGERVRAGIAAAKAAGKTWGGSQPGRLLPGVAMKEQAVLDLWDEGHSISQIARTVHLSRPTVYKLLNRRALLLPV